MLIGIAHGQQDAIGNALLWKIRIIGLALRWIEMDAPREQSVRQEGVHWDQRKRKSVLKMTREATVSLSHRLRQVEYLNV